MLPCHPSAAISETIEDEMNSDEYDWKTHKELLHAQAEQSHSDCNARHQDETGADQTIYDRSSTDRKACRQKGAVGDHQRLRRLAAI